jgi:hypothetical protein
MAQITKLLNGNAKNNDSDIQALAKLVLEEASVMNGLEVTTNLVGSGKCFLPVTRTGDENNPFFVLFELSSDLVIDTSGTKKVFISIPQANIDNSALNTEQDGTGVASVQTAASYPADNYIPLASITSGVITDERVMATLKESLYSAGSGAITDSKIKAAFDASKWKDAALVATTVDITLSGFQTIDTIGVDDGDIVLVKDQSDKSENGIYIVRTGAWERVSYFNTPNNATSAVVAVTRGVQGGELIFYCTALSPVIGTDDIDFVAINKKADDIVGNDRTYEFLTTMVKGDLAYLVDDSGTVKADIGTKFLGPRVRSSMGFSNSGYDLYAVSDTTYVISYVSSSTMYARVLTVNNTTGLVTVGSQQTVSSNVRPGSNSVCRVDTNKVVFSYGATTGGGNPHFCHARVATISGNTISVNAAVEVSSNGSTTTDTTQCRPLSDNKVIIYYSIGSSAYIRIGDVISTTIIFTESQTGTGGANTIPVDTIDVLILSPTAFAVVFEEWVTIYSYVGSVITLRQSIFDMRGGGSSYSRFSTVTKVDTDKFLFCYRDSSNVYWMRVFVFNSTTFSFTPGPLTKIIDADVNTNYATIISNGINKGILFYTDNNGAANSSYYRTFVVTGSSPSLGSPFELPDNSPGLPMAANNPDNNRVLSAIDSTSNIFSVLDVNATQVVVKKDATAGNDGDCIHIGNIASSASGELPASYVGGIVKNNNGEFSLESGDPIGKVTGVDEFQFFGRS